MKKYPQASVFQDDQRHTCIRIAVEPDGVTFIPMHSSGLRVETLGSLEFERTYATQLEDYPVKQAATSYLGATWLEVTPEARAHLDNLTESPTTTESKMATAAKAAPKKVAAPKAAPAPKAEKAPAPKAAAPAKKVEAPKVAKAPKAEKAAAGPDKRKITLVSKENPKREGSASHARYALYKNGMTVDAFVEAGGLLADVAWDVKKGFITVA